MKITPRPLLLALSTLSLLSGQLLALNTATADKALETTASSLKNAPIINHFDGHIELGFGYDSNPYRTPSKDYVDYSPAVDQNITVDKKSGFFTPVNIKLSYTRPLAKQADLFAEYNLDGRLYYGSELQNATTYTQKIEAGALYRLTKSEKRKHQISFALLGADHYETYVDQDNGEYKNSSSSGTGTDIPERYRYRYSGIEMKYERETKVLDYAAKFVYKNYDYEKAAAWSELDYSYYKIALDAEYHISKEFSAALGLSRYIKDYAYRPSYDINTVTLNYAAPVYYTYNRADFALKYKVIKKFKAGLAYKYIQRSDEHQGYNDYAYNALSADATYTFNPDLHLDASISGFTQRYANALAFDELGQSAKSYDGQEADLALRYRYKKLLYLAAELAYKQQQSSDKRYEYERLQSLVSAKMKF